MLDRRNYSAGCAPVQPTGACADRDSRARWKQQHQGSRHVKSILLATAVLGGLACTSPAHAGLIGAGVTYDALEPNKTTVVFSVPQQTITAATSIADTSFPHGDVLTSTFTDTEIDALFTGIGGTLSSTPFNGSGYVFSGVNITGATLDTSASSDLSGAIVTFDASDIFVNLAGLQLANSDHFTIDVTSTAVGAVPEPASMAIFGAGLGALGLTRRRKRKAD
jgi:hypothetical protein